MVRIFSIQLESAACLDKSLENSFEKEKQKTTMSTFATILFLMGLVRSTQTLDGNQLLFTVIGETTRESGYAHLVVPLPVPS